MAIRSPKITWFSQDLQSGQPVQDPTVAVVTWSGVLQGDTCSPVNLAHWADRSIEINGTPGSGGSIAVTGGNSGTNYFNLKDVFQNVLSSLGTGVYQINELTGYLQPVLTGGDGTTSLNLVMLCRRPQDLFMGGVVRP